MPTQKRLGHGVHLIVVSAVRELNAFFDEIVHPGRVFRVGQVHVPGFDWGLIACARAILPPEGFTGRRPGISY